jgi:hypothetical protein
MGGAGRDGKVAGKPVSCTAANSASGTYGFFKEQPFTRRLQDTVKEADGLGVGCAGNHQGTRTASATPASVYKTSGVMALALPRRKVSRPSRQLRESPEQKVP